MTYYIEFTARPDDMTSSPVLLSALYERLHLILVNLGTSRIGISFPRANRNIGEILRLHGPSAILNQIVENQKLKPILGYFRSSGVLETPAECDWWLVQRQQPQLSSAKIRRLVKRGSISEVEATRLYKLTPRLSLPYLHIRSLSTQQKFRLFISQTSTSKPVKTQEFNAYGFGGAIPRF